MEKLEALEARKEDDRPGVLENGEISRNFEKILNVGHEINQILKSP